MLYLFELPYNIKKIKFATWRFKIKRKGNGYLDSYRIYGSGSRRRKMINVDGKMITEKKAWETFFQAVEIGEMDAAKIIYEDFCGRVDKVTKNPADGPVDPETIVNVSVLKGARFEQVKAATGALPSQDALRQLPPAETIRQLRSWGYLYY